MRLFTSGNLHAKFESSCRYSLWPSGYTPGPKKLSNSNKARGFYPTTTISRLFIFLLQSVFCRRESKQIFEDTGFLRAIFSMLLSFFVVGKTRSFPGIMNMCLCGKSGGCGCPFQFRSNRSPIRFQSLPHSFPFWSTTSSRFYVLITFASPKTPRVPSHSAPKDSTLPPQRATRMVRPVVFPG